MGATQSTDSSEATGGAAAPAPAVHALSPAANGGGEAAGSETSSSPTVIAPTRAALRNATWSALPVYEMSSGPSHSFGVSLARSKSKGGNSKMVAIDGLALASARDAEGQPIRPSRASFRSTGGSATPSSRASKVAQRASAASPWSNAASERSASSRSNTADESFARKSGLLSSLMPWKRKGSSHEDAWDRGWGPNAGTPAAPPGLGLPLPRDAEGVPDHERAAAAPGPAQAAAVPRPKFTNEPPPGLDGAQITGTSSSSSPGGGASQWDA